MTAKIVLLTGLPGSGKTTLAEKLTARFGGSHINADQVRAAADDWDFSTEGRRRQFERMRAATLGKEGYVFLDFVCPVNDWRRELKPDVVIWMDTIQISRYQDTNKVFEKPDHYDLRITDFHTDMIGEFSKIKPSFDYKAPTVQMLGRWQPWHDGHTALFEQAIKKTGQVVIMMRDIDDKDNPFDEEEVRSRIQVALADKGWQLDVDYILMLVPNITDISYGRKVGYTLTQHDLGEKVHSISATNLRKQMGL